MPNRGVGSFRYGEVQWGLNITMVPKTTACSESPPRRVSFLPKNVVCSPFTLLCPRRREGKWKLLQKTLQEGLGLRETQNWHWGKLCNCSGSTAQHELETFLLHSLIYVCNTRGAVSRPAQSGWLDQGSWHVFCARAQLEVPAQVVLHLFHDCLQLGRGLRWAGRKAKTPSVQALLGLFCCCPEKAQFVHGASCCWKLRKPKHGWSQKELHKPMAGGSWMAFEWCLRNNINTKISSNREYNRKNSHACPLVQVISQSLMLPTSIRFHFSTRQNLNSFPNRGRKKAATQNKLQCVWIGEWEEKRRQGVLPGQDRGTECSNLLTQHQWNRVTVSVWQKKHVQDFRRQLKNF